MIFFEYPLSIDRVFYDSFVKKATWIYITGYMGQQHIFINRNILTKSQLLLR